MKKLFAFFLVISFCIMLAIPASAADQQTSPNLENLDEQLVEELSRLTEDELNEYILNLHILELTQSNILNDSYPFPDDTDEALRDALSVMTIDELNEYIHRLYLMNTSRDYNIDKNPNGRNLTLRAAWLAAAQVAKLAGYPCAGTIVESSALGNDYIESNGLLANTIQTTDAYAAWVPVGGTSITFTKSDCSDLFYALHQTSVSVIGSPSHVRVRITDVFDFVFETDMEDLFSTLVNDWGWLSQNINALSVIDIQVDIYH